MNIMQTTQVLQPPFYLQPEEETQLRAKVNKISPSPVISNCKNFDDFVNQLMIPNTVMELARKVANIELSKRELEGIRLSLKSGKLKAILENKAQDDPSHPPYIRVACTNDDVGSPVILEIWPGQHYSPIHSHGATTGIIYCLTGELDVMLYDHLDWNAEKLGLVTLNKGDCAWLNETHFPVHKVFAPMPEDRFAASLHAYINPSELPDLQLQDRDRFDFVHEDEPHQLDVFLTHSDLTWHQLREEIDQWVPTDQF